MGGLTIARARINPMLGHPEVPQNSPVAAHPLRLLSNKHSFPISSLESTLPQVFILNNLKSFRINTYAKTQGRGPRLFPPSNLEFTRKVTPKHTGPTIFRRFFQVPYALSPLFATLTKTAGVYLVCSQFETRPLSTTSCKGALDSPPTEHGSRITGHVASPPAIAPRQTP